MGPLLFALALTAVLDEIDAEALELNAWYLDDGTVGGTLLAVRSFLDALIAKAAEHDLQLNIAKCEIVCADDRMNIVRASFAHLPDLRIVPASRLFLLGTPLGSPEAAKECLGVVAERAERRSRLIPGLFNPVVASALLRYCTGFCLGNFYARGVGCLDRAAYARIDAAALTAWELVNFPLESQALQDLAKLPTNYGGMGIRSLKDHCGLAFVAGSVAAREHFHAVLNEHALAAIRGAVDDRLVMPLLWYSSLPSWNSRRDTYTTAFPSSMGNAV